MTFIWYGCCLALEAKGFGMLGGQGSFLVYKEEVFSSLGSLGFPVGFCLILSEYWMLGDRVRHSFSSSEWLQCAFVNHLSTVLSWETYVLGISKHQWRRQICLKEIVNFTRLCCSLLWFYFSFNRYSFPSSY